MPSVEEALSNAEKIMIQSIDDVITIDGETREIFIPESEKLFGVENDKKAERKYFSIPKIVGNNLDISKANLYINYQNANGEKDSYVVTDAHMVGDNIEFTWELYSNVTEYRGNISFIVLAKWSDSKGIVTNRFNTTLATGISLQGLDADEQVQRTQYDILEQLLHLYNVNVSKQLIYDKTNKSILLK